MKKTKLENSFAATTPLHATGNLSMEPTGRTGEPLVQTFGGEAPMSNVPVPTWPIEPNTLGATRQSFGGQAPLSTKPQKSFGVEANELPYSDRAVKQSY